MASKQQTIAEAVKALVVAVGVDTCFIGSGSHVTQDKYPYGQVFIKWGVYDPGSFLVVDQQYLLTVRIVHTDQDLAAEKAEAVLPALLNVAGRTALFTAGVNNIIPIRENIEFIRMPVFLLHQDLPFAIRVRHTIGS